MIDLTCLDIIKLEDYDKLKVLVNKEYIHEHFIEEFKKRIGIKANKIYIEYPYYDNDYLSTYYDSSAERLKKSAYFFPNGFTKRFLPSYGCCVSRMSGISGILVDNDDFNVMWGGVPSI